ncbi:hypothetical protein ADUPG1_006182, partial [Aduncisulcus paluster]
AASPTGRDLVLPTTYAARGTVIYTSVELSDASDATFDIDMLSGPIYNITTDYLDSELSSTNYDTFQLRMSVPVTADNALEGFTLYVDDIISSGATINVCIGVNATGTTTFSPMIECSDAGLMISTSLTDSSLTLPITQAAGLTAGTMYIVIDNVTSTMTMLNFQLTSSATPTQSMYEGIPFSATFTDVNPKYKLLYPHSGTDDDVMFSFSVGSDPTVDLPSPMNVFISRSDTFDDNPTFVLNSNKRQYTFTQSTFSSYDDIHVMLVPEIPPTVDDSYTMDFIVVGAISHALSNSTTTSADIPDASASTGNVNGLVYFRFTPDQENDILFHFTQGASTSGSYTSVWWLCVDRAPVNSTDTDHCVLQDNTEGTNPSSNFEVSVTSATAMADYLWLMQNVDSGDGSGASISVVVYLDMELDLNGSHEIDDLRVGGKDRYFKTTLANTDYLNDLHSCSVEFVGSPVDVKATVCVSVTNEHPSIDNTANCMNGVQTVPFVMDIDSPSNGFVFYTVRVAANGDDPSIAVALNITTRQHIPLDTMGDLNISISSTSLNPLYYRYTVPNGFNGSANAILQPTDTTQTWFNQAIVSLDLILNSDWNNNNNDNVSGLASKGVLFAHLTTVSDIVGSPYIDIQLTRNDTYFPTNSTIPFTLRLERSDSLDNEGFTTEVKMLNTFSSATLDATSGIPQRHAIYPFAQPADITVEPCVGQIDTMAFSRFSYNPSPATAEYSSSPSYGQSVTYHLGGSTAGERKDEIYYLAINPKNTQSSNTKYMYEVFVLYSPMPYPRPILIDDSLSFSASTSDVITVNFALSEASTGNTLTYAVLAVPLSGSSPDPSKDYVYTSSCGCSLGGLIVNRGGVFAKVNPDGVPGDNASLIVDIPSSMKGWYGFNVIVQDELSGVQNAYSGFILDTTDIPFDNKSSIWNVLFWILICIGCGAIIVIVIVCIVNGNKRSKTRRGGYSALEEANQGIAGMNVGMNPDGMMDYEGYTSIAVHTASDRNGYVPLDEEF